MEADKNIMPPIELFPRAMRVVHFIFDHLRHPGLSDHARGAGPALDSALYDQPTTRMAQVELNFDGDGRMVYSDPLTHVRELDGRWDDGSRTG